MLKRILSLVLGLTLLMGAALAEGNNVNLVASSYDDPDGVRTLAMAVTGEWVYLALDHMMGSSEPWLARWQPGMDAPEKMADLSSAAASDSQDETWPQDIRYMFADGAQVYGMSYTGHVTRLVNQDGEAVLERLYQLDMSGLMVDYGDYSDYASMSSLFAQEGKLYALGYLYTQEGKQKHMLNTFDLATGESLACVEDTELRLIAPYQDGQILGIVLPGGEGYDESTGKPTPYGLSVCSLDGVETQRLYTFEDSSGYASVAALCYDAVSQTGYCLYQAELIGLPGLTGQPVTYAYLPTSVYYGSSVGLGVLQGTVGVIQNYDCVYVRQLDAQAASQGALTIAGEYGSDAHSAVIQAHPEMPILLTSDYFADLESITTAMVSGDDAVDLMRLSYGYAPVDRLIQKGYAADLSGLGNLMERAQHLVPGIRDACIRDGKLYFLPVSCYPSVLGYRVEALEALGLTEDDLPKTIVELFDFCANFSYDYGAEHPEVALLSDIGFRDQLMSMMMYQYIAYQLKTTGSISFDTELFRKLMSALEALDLSEWDPYEIYGDDLWSDADKVNEFYDENRLGLLVYTGVSPSDFGNNRYIKPLLLSLDEGIERIIPINGMEGFVLNPRSTHMSQAEEYLTVYLENLPWEASILLFEDTNDPVPNPYYESNLASVQQTIDELQQQLEAAAPENRAELEDSLKYMQEYLKEIEDYRYFMDEEDIARFREEVTPYLYPLPQTPLTNSEESLNFSQLMQQYKQHAIDLETYIQEVERRLRLIQLEGM